MREGGFFVPNQEKEISKINEQKPHHENRGVSFLRNKFLRCLGLAAALFSAEAASPSVAHAQETTLGSSMAEAPKKESLEKMKNDIRQEIRQHEELNFSLNKEEIVEALVTCPFLKKEDIKIVDIQVSEQQEPESEKNVLKEALEEAVDDGIIQKESAILQVVRLDFSKILHPMYSAAYIEEYNAIILPLSDSSTDSVVREFFGEKFHQEQTDHLIKNADLQNWDNEMKRVEEETNNFKAGLHSFDDVPDSYIDKYGESFKAKLQASKESSALVRGFLKNSLPHEAFHFLFDNFLVGNSTEYTGPSLESLLEIALEMKKMRYGEGENPKYYPLTGNNVDTIFSYFHISSPEDLKGFCKKLAEYIRSNAQKSDTVNVFTPEETEKNLLLEQASIFANESLARSFTIAIGLNKQKKIENMELEMARFGKSLTPDMINTMAASPDDVYMLTAAEIHLLEKVNIRGRSAILPENQAVYDDLK